MMDLTLGKLTLRAACILLYENMFSIRRQRPFSTLEDASTLYTWACATQTGDPAQPPAAYSAKSYLHFHVLDANDQPDEAAARATLDRFVQASGLRSRRAFSDAFSQLCPNISFPIDATTLIDPFKANYRFELIGFPVYHIFVVTPNGGLPGDHAYLMMPYYIYLSTRFQGTCNDAAEPGISGLLATGGGYPAWNDTQLALRESALADNRVAADRLRED